MATTPKRPARAGDVRGVVRGLRRDAGARRRLHDALGRAGRAALHRGRPARRTARPRSDRAARRLPVHARRLPVDVPRAAVDDAPVRRLRHGEETNERFRYLLDHGQTGLSTAFDMPSLMGHDSDHPRSLGEVGREGVAVDTLDDMETLFGGIDLGEVSVSMTINAPAAIMLAFYVVAAERAGRPARAARRHDPGRHPQGVHRPEGVVLPDRPGDAPVGDMIEWCSQQMPRWHPVSISGYHIREAGSTAAAGARLHAQGRPDLRRAGRRARPRRRRLRAAPVVLLQRPDRLLRGDRQVPRGAAHLGARAARDLRRARTRSRG